MAIKIDVPRMEVRGIPVQVVRKGIKNVHIGVYPPHGRVRVAVPLSVDDDAVRLAVISRLSWIRRKRAEFMEQERQTLREFVSGESHYFEGRRYRLDVVEIDGPPSVSLLNNKWMRLQIRPGSDRDMREGVLDKWYRRRLRERLPTLLEKWQPVVGESVTEVRIRKMKTRWGSCNDEARRIWLNLELAKKPPACVEYVLVHELVHLLDRRHDDHFRELMDEFMPAWRARRDELNRGPLAHATWVY